jgi:adenylosuccinate synthase
MALRIVLLSGPIGAGKTTLAENLKQYVDAQIIKTRNLISILAASDNHFVVARTPLEEFSEKLDVETGGRWVADEVEKIIGQTPKEKIFVVDSVRIQQQIDELRTRYGMSVFHIHMTGDQDVISRRYTSRTPKFPELSSYEEAQRNQTEANIEGLAQKADAVINTTECTAADVWVRAATHLHLFPRNYERLVDVLVGGQFGSEGKGHIASFLSKEYQVLVRVGGPNAGHSVFERPEPFVHHQLPCGTRSTTATLIIAPGATLRLSKLLEEVHLCKVDSPRLRIDNQAMIISDEDVQSETELKALISSTGQGGGAAAARRIMGRGKASTRLARDCVELRGYVCDTAEVLEDAYRSNQKILVEGTQGTGLSLYHGFYPYVTSRDTTVAGCLSEAGISPTRLRKVVMVCRTYPIRVANATEGTSGPLSRELKWSSISKQSGIPLETLEEKERTSTTRRSRRVGGFDWVQLKRASALNGPTDVALTFVDYLDPANKDARRFEQLSAATIQFIEEIENVAAAPVSMISTRFDFRSILDRRSW